MKDYRPRREDHFVNDKSLVQWLEDHGLPVATKGTSDNPQADNLNTMLVATGGKPRA